MARSRKKKQAPKPVGRVWPLVWCGGPAEPVGPPVLSVEFEVRTLSETNQRNAHAKIRRVIAQREATSEALSFLPAADYLTALSDSGGPWCVRLTRITSKGMLDRSNLPPALKAIERANAATVR